MNPNYHLILSNSDGLDADGWALIAPFGEHRKERVAKIAGVPTRQIFIQVLDNESADALLDKENSLFRRMRRALVGIPVYAGHPDLGRHAPETLANKRDERLIGVVDNFRKCDRGIEARFVLSPEGARAVENEGAKYPSALWMVQPVGERDGAIVARPFKLLSVGLTAHPNISGVESLANARGAGNETETEPDMKLIAGWLIANGVALANAESATETQVLEALQKFHTAKAGEVVTLGNEKTTAAGKITTLENENSALKTKLAEASRRRAGDVVDLAIARGKMAVVERDAALTALANAADFDAEATKLLGAATRFKTITDARGAKVLSNELDGGDARTFYNQAIEKHCKDAGETDPIKAHKAVMAAHPQLAEAFKVKSEGAKS